ncbi:hypothetical protein H257_13718 [Aphanomyces astaci]|uniref:Uncharacterized protein n=1 Tax=Aphanomyces astaci TaxID=112090 RepID=W4FU47_APHAT|nr:hypothetical protein H257_13718 [Aphanomyces astaci]ETV70987.1 hypothetical protein H257_13718 [Aphanomyces astaci]|eukprot:XP_009839650.1 hypothetical protein H257_13718 [Aphanomyces astaci]
MTDLATQLAMEQEKNRRLQAEVDRLRKAVVTASLEAEKEEEFIVNSFIRRMEQKQKAMAAAAAAKASRTQPALHVQRLAPPHRDSYYEAEMKRLRDDKVALGVRFEQEQESMLNRLMRQFKSTSAKQKRLNRGPVAAVAC